MNSENLPSLNINSSSTSFRQNNWGDTNHDVISKEGLDYNINSDTLIKYTDKKVMGLNCEVNFSFKYSRLYYGSIEFKPNYSDLNEYITLFYALRSSLTNDIGYPTHNDKKWINTRYKENCKMAGFAISIGDFSMTTGWIFPTNGILLNLDKEEAPVSLRLSAIAPSK